MDFALDDQQSALVESFRKLFATHSTPAHVRRHEGTGGFDADLWAELCQVGALTMAVPEAAGGWGASLLDLSLVADELGRALGSVPLIGAQVAARLLASSGADVSELAEIFSGQSIVAFALHRAQQGWLSLVPGGSVATSVVFLDDQRLKLVAVSQDDRRLVDNLASDSLADLRVGTDALTLGSGSVAVEAYERAVDEWLVLSASGLVGMGHVAHRQACEYARERLAFGAPIGSFQGVSHPLANAATNLDGAEFLSRYAAWSMQHQPSRGAELAAMAFAFASQTVEAVTYDSIHFHGGYGFMMENDLQLYFRRARGWSRLWGDAEAAYLRAARARLGLGR